jgi:predicted porin
VTGTTVQTLRDPQVYQAGIQATAFGFTVGGTYMWGNTRFFYIPTTRGDKEMEQWFVGASYTAGPFTIGANTFVGQYAGASGGAFNTTTGAFTGTTARQGQRRYAYSVGANYRLAPGLDLVAEYTRHVIHERGVDLDNQTSNGVNDRLRANVFLVGTRLAF